MNQRRGRATARPELQPHLTATPATVSANLMHKRVQVWTCWLGERVHPLRLGIETLSVAWALWPIGILFSVFLARLTYPMDIEWCEGGILYQAYRLIHGLPVYARNDPVWTPWSYPIGHTLVLALVGLFKCDFWSGRLVSIVFFCLLCAALFREVYQHLERSSFGVALGALTVAVIACAYPVVGQWYDLIRVDTMAMSLSVIGIARVYRLGVKWRDTLITAAILTGSIYTKQTSAFFVAWACLFAIAREPRRGLRVSIVTGLLCLAVLGLLQWGTNGSYWFWTVTDLKGQTVEDPRLVDGLRQVWTYAPFVVLFPFAFLLIVLRGLLSSRTLLWTGSLIMAIPATLLPYAKVGGYLNNLIPLIVLLGPVAALMFADVAKGGGWLGLLARWGAIVGLGLFVWSRPLHPDEYIPTKRDIRAANELNALVASLPGAVVVPDLAFLPARTGHTNPHWYSMAMWCAIWSGRPMNMALAFEKSGARWVIMHSRAGDDFSFYVKRHFQLARKIPDNARVRMITGAGVTLDDLWEKLPTGTSQAQP